MTHVFLSVLPIFLLIVTGKLCARFFVQQEVFWKSSDKLVYYIFFPCLLVLEIGSADFAGSATGMAIIGTVGGTLLVALIIFLGRCAVPVEDRLFTSIFQGGTRYNSYVFIAMSQMLFGDAGVALAGVFIAWMIVLTNFTSVLVLNHYGEGGKKSLRGMFHSLATNPLIVAALIGLLVNALDWQIHSALRQFMKYLGNAATPLSLMSVGAGLILVMPASKIWATVYAVVLKLLLLPAATLLILHRLDASGLAANTALLYACMPCAGNAYILARQMGGDMQAMAAMITWSTLGSVLTMTLVLGNITL